MSRVYVDYEMEPLDQGRWDHNLHQTIRGKKGQALLRDLERALVEMPEKRLIADDLVSETGECCTVGALCAYRKSKAEGLSFRQAALALPNIDTQELGEREGLSSPLAWFLVYQNDDSYEFGRLSPEDRYTQVLAWVRRVLRPESGGS